MLQETTRIMTEEELKEMAAQLRKPSGEYGLKTGEWMNNGNFQMNQETLKVLDPKNAEQILEIGMGNGLFVKDILKNKPLLRYTGCDFSNEMVKEAKKLNSTAVNSMQALFIQTNANKLPFENGSFDKLFTVNTIYFWDDESAVLKEFKRVLRPGGSLIISLRPKHQMIKYPFTKYGFTMFSKEDLNLLLKNNGFLVSHVYENTEPDLELHGEILKLENLIVIAKPHSS